MGRVPGHPPDGAKLGERRSIVARAVRRDAGGLPRDREPRSKMTGVPGVLPGPLGVVVQDAAGGDQVRRDLVGERRRQAAELRAGLAVQLARRDVVGKAGLGHPRAPGILLAGRAARARTVARLRAARTGPLAPRRATGTVRTTRTLRRAALGSAGAVRPAV